MTELFEQLHNKIIEIISNSPVEEDPTHSEQVLKFVQEMDSMASEELQIAALAHDIERGVSPRTEQEVGESYDGYKQRHAKRSAEITAGLMKELGYSAATISKVQKLIENHEIGGGRETDILRDADSASYFANNINSYLARNGEKRTKEKIKLMYERASERTKEIIKSLEYSSEVRKLINEVVS